MDSTGREGRDKNNERGNGNPEKSGLETLVYLIKNREDDERDKTMVSEA